MSTTKTYLITSGSNDAWNEYAGSNYYYNTGSNLRVGFLSSRRSIHLLFAIDIPKNATILSAKLQYKGYNNTTGSCLTKINLKDTDNATMPTTGNEAETLTYSLTYPSSDITWDMPDFSNDVWYDSPDISSLIQKAVNRTNWVSGNNILVVHCNSVDSGFDRNIYSYEYNSTNAPKLVVTYNTVADTTPPANVTNLTIANESNHAVLSWTNPVDSDFSTCKIYIYGSSYVASTSFGSYYHSMDSISDGQSFRITSVDTTGNESSGVTVTYYAPIVNATISTPNASSNANTRIPNVTAIKNINISTPNASSNANTRIPNVTAIKNINISTPNANSIINAKLPVVTTTTNLIQNGDFSQGGTSWNTYQGLVSFVNNRLQIDTSDGTYWSNANQTITEIKGNTDYTFKYDKLTVYGSTFIEQYDSNWQSLDGGMGNGAYVNIGEANGIGTTTFNFTTLPTTTFIVVYISNKDSINVGTISFDNVFLYETNTGSVNPVITSKVSLTTTISQPPQVSAESQTIPIAVNLIQNGDFALGGDYWNDSGFANFTDRVEISTTGATGWRTVSQWVHGKSNTYYTFGFHKYYIRGTAFIEQYDSDWNKIDGVYTIGETEQGDISFIFKTLPNTAYIYVYLSNKDVVDLGVVGFDDVSLYEKITEDFETGVLSQAYTYDVSSTHHFVIDNDTITGTHTKVLKSTNQGVDNSYCNINFTFTTVEVGSVDFEYYLSNEIDWDKFGIFLDTAIPDYSKPNLILDWSNSIAQVIDSGKTYYDKNTWSWINPKRETWVTRSIPNVSIGTHTLRFIYQKDESSADGTDTVMIDNISYLGAKPMSYVTNGLQVYLNAKDYPQGSASTIWADKSGNGNDFTLMNFATSGWTGTSLKADGVNDYAILNKEGLLPYTGYTVELYVKRSSTSIDWRPILKNGINTDYYYATALFNNGSYTTANGDTGGDTFETTSTKDTFYHCTLVWDGTYKYIYVNGVNVWQEIPSASLTPPSTTTTTVTSLFANIDGADATNTEISVLRIYNRALNNIEITQNYTDVVPTTPVNSPQVYYNAKGKTNPSSIWEDLSPNGRNATLNGFAYNTTTSGWNDTDALIFDGSNDNVLTSGFAPISSDTDFTFETVYNLNDVGDGTFCLTSFGSSGQRFYINLYKSGTTQQISFAICGNVDNFPVTFPIGVKTHFVFKRTLGRVQILINGSSVYDISYATISGSISIGNGYYIGTHYSGASNYFNGKIYLNRFYNYALSDAEITQNYNDAISGLQVYLDGADFSNSPQTTVLNNRSRKDNNAIVSGFSYTTLSGSDGNGYIKYDNSNDNMKILQNATINNLGIFTIEFDVKLGASVTGNPRLADKSTSDTCGWQIYINTGTANNYYPSITYYQNGGTQYELFTTSSLALNSTYHISIDVDTTVYPYSNTKVYINNVLQTLTMASGSVSGTYLTDSTADLYIGNRSDNARPFGNSLKTVRLYNRVLTTTEKTQNYNDAIGGTSSPTITIKSYTRTKISNVTGMTKSTITFQSSQDLSQWEARADGVGVGTGDLVGSGTTASANTDISFDVDNTELTWGDKSYRIDIYGKNLSGVWNSHE